MTDPQPGTVPAADQAPVEETVATARVVRPASGSRLRWVVALVVVAIAAAVAAGAAILLGSRPTPEALTYIPADSTVVAELRMDLPGDQLQKVGNLLAHFPGFKDQSTLPSKLDEAFQRLTGNATNGAVDYDRQLKPWLAGPLFVGSSSTDVESADFTGVIVATTDGTASCAQVFGDATTTTETVGALSILENADRSEGCLLDGRIGLIGTPSVIQAAMDAHQHHTGIDTIADYRTARDTLGEDRLATIYVAKAALTSGAFPSGVPLASPLASDQLAGAFAALPAWEMVGVRAEDDAIVLDAVSAPIDTATLLNGATVPPAPAPHVSRIAPLVPADSLALVELHGVGASIVDGLAALRANPSLAAGLDQVDQSLAALGGVDGLVGWVNDAGIVVVPDGQAVSGGVVIEATDAATAAQKVAQVRGIALLALGTRVTVSDTQVGGTTMTTYDLGPFSGLAGSLGVSQGSLPISPDTHVVLAVAVKGSTILAGGDAFVRSSLEVQAGSSLADAAPYQHGISRATAANSGQVYLAAKALVALAEGTLPADQKAAFDANDAPYLAPFDTIVATIESDGGRMRLRLVATVQ